MSDCPGCNLPMINGQALNGLLQCHWDCQDVVRKNMGEENAENLIQLRINQRLRMEGLDETHRLWKTLGGN